MKTAFIPFIIEICTLLKLQEHIFKPDEVCALRDCIQKFKIIITKA